MMELDPTDKSRQKSCNACVRSKRRCDKRTPKCTRCIQKNYSCVYQNVPSDVQADGSCPRSAGVETMDAAPDHDFHIEPSQASLSSLGLPNDFSMVTEASAPLDMGFEFNSMLDFLTVDQSQNDMQLWQVPDSAALVAQSSLKLPPIPSSSKSITLDIEGLSSYTTECDSYQPWQLHEPDSKAGFLVNVMKNLHVGFARDKASPFLHRYLYRHNLPRPMLQAYTAITTYANRTDANKEWAIRVLCEAVSDLKSSTAITPYEKLARVHAMMFYQAIRCYDGDVTLRSMADNDMPQMLIWAEDLEKYRDNLDDLWALEDFAIRQRPPKSWDRWIFSESLRRTVLIMYAFVSMYEILKNPGKMADPRSVKEGFWSRSHRWTVSKHLWDAESSSEFLSAWREKPQFFVQDFLVHNLTKYARPEDIDDCSRIILTMHIGVRDTEQFLAGGSMG